MLDDLSRVPLSARLAAPVLSNGQFEKRPRLSFLMAFEIPDYSYGVADAILVNIDYLLRVGTDSTDRAAKTELEEARRLILSYKDRIFDQVMQ